jgi:uncharacterized membrane protein YdjX (TVP38/TMEM64 family)
MDLEEKAEIEYAMQLDTEEDKPKKSSINHTWIRLFILLAIIGGFTVLFYKSHLIHLFLSKDRLSHFLESLGPWAFLGFILLQALQVVAAPIPGEVTGLLGGYLYGPLLGVALSTAGLTIGSYAAFALSRFLGRPFVEKFVSKPTMDRFDYLLHHRGAFLIFFLFLIPGFPKDYLCYILGLGHLSTMEFLVIGITGRLLGTILLTLGGAYLRLHQYWKFSALLGIAVVLILVAMAYRDRLECWLRKLHSGSRCEKEVKTTDRSSDL